MINLSLRLLLGMLLLSGLLCACTGPQPAPENPPNPDSAAISPTSPLPTLTPPPAPTPTPPGSEALLEAIESLPKLEPGNVSELTYQGGFSLNNRGHSYSLQDWSENGEWLAVCYDGNPGQIEIHHFASGLAQTLVEVNKWECQHGSETVNEAFQFSRDGDLLAAPLGNGFGVYQTSSGALVSELEHEVPGYLEQLAFSSQGSRIAAGFYLYRAIQGGGKSSDEIHLFDVETGAHWGIFQKRVYWYLTDLAYSTEGEYLVTAGYGDVEAWHVEGGVLDPVPCHNGEISFSPIEETAALACRPDNDDEQENWRQLVWHLPSGEIKELEKVPGDEIIDLKYSSDGLLLLGYTDYGRIHIWDALKGTWVFTLEGPISSFVDASFILNDRGLAVVDRLGGVYLYGIGVDGD